VWPIVKGPVVKKLKKQAHSYDEQAANVAIFVHAVGVLYELSADRPLYTHKRRKNDGGTDHPFFWVNLCGTTISDLATPSTEKILWVCL
jgi:hypothetical protein